VKQINLGRYTFLENWSNVEFPSEISLLNIFTRKKTRYNLLLSEARIQQKEVNFATADAESKLKIIHLSCVCIFEMIMPYA